ncbi:response regulator [Pseudophaeobacter leonis]|uniref:response regulator n=1 Tax=Pseudophaeobacter leonis TaxID=1144477 RepID=UPI0009F56E7C|nr:response regulator [Pseudophaeobacter leonis]
MAYTKSKDPRPKCLIVEDDEFDRLMMFRTAKTAINNFVITAVTSLEAARQVLMAGPASLILLDNSLPDGKGSDFALGLAQSPSLAETPIIIVSDWPSPFMWDKASAAGVRRVVTKSDLNPNLICEILRAS